MQTIKALAIVMMSMSPVAAFVVQASQPTVTLMKISAETIMVDGEMVTFTHSGFQVH